MAEEPQPSTVHEGASDPHAPTSTAEDRKAAAALSSLDAQDAKPVGDKNVNTKALDEAMKNLSVESKAGSEKRTVSEKKTVKVAAADVTLLVSELEISKVKATDLLKAHDGDAVNAMKAFVAFAC
ncbi:hypothetical protein M011DRAFT_10799 [Sporormia fimetaria CBS 119925]|uniref:Nascent polypeptide-associated complex subunit alpha-like UBA domain-containing protein n=1 Tax=Sporormia fimetaria CBS 119925 TaxID=1340428 RepID=A0A6A6VQ14_9PLEO|nr:hypothetical protein M011DRAFT_10799 [Sporormia fimetaria CBS 119925]